jgi:hypothetical protein
MIYLILPFSEGFVDGGNTAGLLTEDAATENAGC